MSFSQDVIEALAWLKLQLLVDFGAKIEEQDPAAIRREVDARYLSGKAEPWRFDVDAQIYIDGTVNWGYGDVDTSEDAAWSPHSDDVVQNLIRADLAEHAKRTAPALPGL